MTGKSPIRYLAIDDSPLDLLLLKEYAAAFPVLQFAGSVQDPQEALLTVPQLKPDLVFLDIEMPGLTGINLLQQIRQQVPMAVFITSHPEFALDGFELSALDYVLKPLTADRFALTAARIEEFWEMKQKASAYAVLFEQEMLLIKEGHSQIRLPQHEIIYLEAMQDYTKVVTDKKSYMTLTTLTSFLEKLSPQKFLRVHRSYAVAISRITELSTGKVGCGHFSIPIGKTYRAQIANLNLLP